MASNINPRTPQGAAVTDKLIKITTALAVIAGAA
jgi:hypothetical protein